MEETERKILRKRATHALPHVTKYERTPRRRRRPSFESGNPGAFRVRTGARTAKSLLGLQHRPRLPRDSSDSDLLHYFVFVPPLLATLLVYHRCIRRDAARTDNKTHPRRTIALLKEERIIGWVRSYRVVY